MQVLAFGQDTPFADKSIPASTSYSSIKKLVRNGYVMRLDKYEIEDPFFREWIRKM